ncbi:MAG: protein NO VEIN domain-containing protein, partial [bacterium]
RIYCEPLVLFDRPVRLEYARRTAQFDRLRAYPHVPGSTQTLWQAPDGFLELDPEASLVIGRNCSLPYELFTTADLVALAAKLQQHWTGESAQQRALAVREGLTLLARLAEAHAVIFVWERLKTAGWAIGDYSHKGNTGWDLMAIAKLRNGRRRIASIEVKGTDKAAWRGNVTLRRSQWNAALAAAKSKDPTSWMLAIVTRANDPAHRQLQCWSAVEVRDHWPKDHVAS